MSDCYVYVIGSATDDGQPVKIGIANSPALRVLQVQTYCPFYVAVLGTWRCPSRRAALRIEQNFHYRFDDCRRAGEWFAITADEAIQGLDDLCLEICELVAEGNGAWARYLAEQIGIGVSALSFAEMQKGSVSCQ